MTQKLAYFQIILHVALLLVGCTQNSVSSMAKRNYFLDPKEYIQKFTNSKEKILWEGELSLTKKLEEIPDDSWNPKSKAFKITWKDNPWEDCNLLEGEYLNNQWQWTIKLYGLLTTKNTLHTLIYNLKKNTTQRISYWKKVDLDRYILKNNNDNTYVFYEITNEDSKQHTLKLTKTEKSNEFIKIIKKRKDIAIMQHLLDCNNRILWEGLVKILDKQDNKFINSYILITDDTKIYLFKKNPRKVQNQKDFKIINLQKNDFINIINEETLEITCNYNEDKFTDNCSEFLQNKIILKTKKKDLNDLLHKIRFATNKYLVLDDDYKEKTIKPLQKSYQNVKTNVPVSLQDFEKIAKSKLKEVAGSIINQNNRAINLIISKEGILHIFSSDTDLEAIIDMKAKHIASVKIDTNKILINEDSDLLCNLTPTQQDKLKLKKLEITLNNEIFKGLIYCFLEYKTCRALESANYHIINLNCQVKDISDGYRRIYLLINKYIKKTTFKKLCKYLEKYFNAKIEILTHHTKSQNLIGTDLPINWQLHKNFDVLFSKTIIGSKIYKNEVNCHKSIAEENRICDFLTCEYFHNLIKKQENITKENKPKFLEVKRHLKSHVHKNKITCPIMDCPIQKAELYRTKTRTLKDEIHLLTYIHKNPYKEKYKLAIDKNNNIFAYNDSFSKLNAIELPSQNPLNKINNPFYETTLLLQEAIYNGHLESLLNIVKKANILTPYETEDEDSLLSKVEVLINSDYHKGLGSPLSRPELCSLIMYTDYSALCADFRWSQISGDYNKWKIMDQHLMDAIIKLNEKEKEKNKKKYRTLYHGLKNIKFDENIKQGFLSTYTSTTTQPNVAKNFIGSDGMMICLKKSFQKENPYCHVSWVSNFPAEDERLFARSADTLKYKASKWQGKVFGNNKNLQKINFELALPSLIVPPSHVRILTSDITHSFSYIKLGKNSILTTTSYNTESCKGGKLLIKSLGDCILEEGASIDVCGLGYPDKGVKTNNKYSGREGQYCAGGGSYKTRGDQGYVCSVNGLKTTQCSQINSIPLSEINKYNLPLGNPGGAIKLPQIKVSNRGAKGGGALFIDILGSLKMHKNSNISSNGEEASSFTGGAGSGGTVYLSCLGNIELPDGKGNFLSAKGGSSNYSAARGVGGDGVIVFNYFINMLPTLCSKKKFSPTHKVLEMFNPHGTVCLNSNFSSFVLLNWLRKSKKYFGNRIKYLLKMYLGLNAILPESKENEIHNINLANDISIDYLLKKAQQKIKDNQYDAAIEYCNKSLTLEHHNNFFRQIQNTMAQAYSHKGNYDKAIEYYASTGKKPMPVLEALETIYEKQKAAIHEDYLIQQGLEMYVPLKISKKIEDYEIPQKYDINNLVCDFLDSKVLDIQHTEEKEVFDLDSQKLEIKNSKRLLLLGPSGSGKSLTGKYLVHKINNNFFSVNNKLKKPWFIIYLNMQKLQENKNLIHKSLLEKDLDILTIDTLKKDTSINKLFYLDNFEELLHKYETSKASLTSLEKEFELEKWKNSKFLFACRSQILGLGQVSRYLENIPKRYLSSLTKDQVNIYIKKFTNNKLLNVGEWTNDRFKQELCNSSELKEVAKEPFALNLILSVLPRLKYKHGKSNKISKLHIYRLFFEEWFNNEFEKLYYKHELSEEKENKLKSSFLEYSKKIAAAMFRNNSKIIKIKIDQKKFNSNSNISLHNLVEEEKVNKDNLEIQLDKIVFKGIPLKRIESNKYSFIHKSFYEYFAALYIIDEILCLGAHQHEWNPETFRNTILNNHYLNHKTSIIDFLVQEIKQTDISKRILKDTLFSIIEYSKKTDQINIASANSATLLNASLIPLSYKDWQKVKIPGAKLDGAFLVGTNLSDSNCRGVSLSQAFLEDTKFHSANLNTLEFGEQAYLDHENMVRKAYWSTKGYKIATLNGNNIFLWNGASSVTTGTLKGHTDIVTDIQWSKDNKSIASCSKDKTMILWDIKEKKIKFKCQGHQKAINTLKWSQDNNFIATASKDNTIKIWRTNTGNLVNTLNFEDDVEDVIWSKINNTLLVGTSKNCISKLWDFTKDKVKTFKDGEVVFSNTIISNDDKLLSTSIAKKAIVVWNTETGEKKKLKLKEDKDLKITCAAYSRNNKYLASGRDDKKVVIWNLEAYKMEKVFQGHHNTVTNVVWANQDEYIISTGEDKKIIVWNRKTDQIENIFNGHKDSIKNIHLSADEKFILSYCGSKKDTTVRIWKMLDASRHKIKKGHYLPVKIIKLSNNKKYLASGDSGGKIIIWHLKNNKISKILQKHTYSINDISWFYEDTFLASAGDDNKIIIWNIESGKELEIVKIHKKPINCIHWSSSPPYDLASGGEDKKIKIYNFRDRRLKKTFFEKKNLTNIRWSPNSKYLAVSSHGVLKIRETNSFAEYKVLHCKQKIVNFDWAPNTKKILIAFKNKEIKIYDVLKDQLMDININRSKKIINSVSYRPDKNYIVTTHQDGTIDIWNNNTSKLLKTFRGGSQLSNIDWIDDYTFATGGDDCSIRIWDIEKYQLKNIIGNTQLRLASADFRDSRGLTESNLKLIHQRQGITNFNNIIDIASKGDIFTIMKILKKNKLQINQLINRTNEKGDNILLIFAKKNNLEAITTLLEEKNAEFNFNQTNKNKDNLLTIFAEKNNFKAVKHIIEHCKKLDFALNENYQDKENNSILHIFAKNKNIRAIIWLLKNTEIDYNVRNINLDSLLTIIAYQDHNLVNNILELKCFNISAENKKKDTLATIFAKKNNFLAFKFLINYAKEKEIQLYKLNQACIIFSKLSNLEAVTWILSNTKVDMNTRDEKYGSILTNFAKKDKLKIIKNLVQNGADINIKDENNNNSFKIFVNNNNLDAVKWIIKECNIRLDETQIFKTLEKFAQKNNLEAIQWIKKNLNIDLKNRFGHTVLICFIEKNNLEAIKYLVEEVKLNVNFVDEDTALGVACYQGFFQIIKYLVETAKAKVDLLDRSGNSPITIACGMGFVNIAKYLKTFGADTNKIGKGTYNTPLLKAASKGRTNIVEWLLDVTNANINILDEHNNTALTAAVAEEQYEIVKLLLERGIDKNLKNDDDQTALEIAEEEELIDIIDLLENNDENVLKKHL